MRCSSEGPERIWRNFPLFLSNRLGDRRRHFRRQVDDVAHKIYKCWRILGLLAGRLNFGVACGPLPAREAPCSSSAGSVGKIGLLGSRASAPHLLLQFHTADSHRSGDCVGL